MTLVSNTFPFSQCQFICLVFLFNLAFQFSVFSSLSRSEQESPQVDAHREKAIGAKDGSDGAGGYSGEGDGAQEEDE